MEHTLNSVFNKDQILRPGEYLQWPDKTFITLNDPHYATFYNLFLLLPGTVCTFCFFVGLIFTTGAGEYWLKMFDSFAGTIGLVVVALLEMVSVVYIYGHEK